MCIETNVYLMHDYERFWKGISDNNQIEISVINIETWLKKSNLLST